jgi:hypothetical protein
MNHVSAACREDASPLFVADHPATDVEVHRTNARITSTAFFEWSRTLHVACLTLKTNLVVSSSLT